MENNQFKPYSGIVRIITKDQSDTIKDVFEFSVENRTSKGKFLACAQCMFEYALGTVKEGYKATIERVEK